MKRNATGLLGVTTTLAAFAILLAVLLLAYSPAPSAAYLPHIHSNWAPVSRVTQLGADHTILFALHQRNLAQLEDLFWRVSDPLSDLYGSFLSKEQIANLIAPSKSEINSFVEWLNKNGAKNIEVYATNDVIQATFTLEQIQNIFGVNMYHFIHKDGRHLIRSLEQHDDIIIPKEIRHLVQLVHGISDFPMKTKSEGTRHVDKKIKVTPNITTYGAPIIVGVNARGGNPQITVDYIPTCLDRTNSSTKIPCQGTQAIVEKISILAKSTLDAVEVSYSFTNSPQCQVVNNTTYCSVTISVGFYVPLQITLQENFKGGISGDVSTYEWPVVVTPSVVPQTISQLYSIPPSAQVTNPTVTQSVAEFEEQYYTPDDLSLFFASMGLPDYSNLVTVIGPNDVSNPGVEANLDIQYIMGVGVGAPTVFWSIEQNNTFQADDILEWAYQVGNTTNPPLVHSLSYGMPEDTVEPFFGSGYLARSDVEFQKLALQGLTIIIACGDTGAGDLGEAPMETSCKVLHPDWPSQSPYVTAVGTTFITPFALPICYLPKSQGGINCIDNPLSEASVSLDAGFAWTTGGGFSNVAPRPQYQNDFVEKYFAHPNVLPPSNMFNASGRGYPDFATVGHNIMVAQAGEFIGVDGTSASAPIFGGIITLLNNLRLNKGSTPLGFVNPLFYAIASTVPSAFRDVVVGDNRCGESGFTPECCVAAFKATDGWDAVSGLGSPNYAVLANIILNPQEVLVAGRA